MRTWPVPFARSYWVLPGRLLAGHFPGSPDPDEEQGKLEGLLDAGIRFVVNLMEVHERDHEGKLFSPYWDRIGHLGRERGWEVETHRFPVPDLGIPSREEMVRILDALDGALETGRPAYVHCWGGKGRTGTVVGCYLVRHGLAEGESALARIAELRRRDPMAHLPSPETDEQRRFVLGWRRSL